MHKKIDPFLQARLKLSATFLAISLMALLPFSISLYYKQYSDLERVIIKQNFGTNTPRLLTDVDLDFVQSQFKELKNGIIKGLMALNMEISVIIFIVSFVASGKILSPISESFKREKEFVSNASHELRTPIMSIQMSSEVALRAKNKSLNDFEETLKQIHQSSLGMGHIIEDLLLLSRMDAGVEKQSYTKFDLKELVRSVVKELDPLAQNKNVGFNLNFAEKINEVGGDKNKIKQLLTIIMDNAVKYSKNQGIVTVSLLQAKVPILTITDTGVGISQEEISHIFDRFFRSSSTRNSTQGSGLGLAIAKKIADANNINVVVGSKLNVGTTFTLRFN